MPNLYGRTEVVRRNAFHMSRRSISDWRSSEREAYQAEIQGLCRRLQDRKVDRNVLDHWRSIGQNFYVNDDITALHNLVSPGRSPILDLYLEITYPDINYLTAISMGFNLVAFDLKIANEAVDARIHRWFSRHKGCRRMIIELVRTPSLDTFEWKLCDVNMDLSEVLIILNEAIDGHGDLQVSSKDSESFFRILPFYQAIILTNLIRKRWLDPEGRSKEITFLRERIKHQLRFLDRMKVAFTALNDLFHAEDVIEHPFITTADRILIRILRRVSLEYADRIMLLPREYLCLIKNVRTELVDLKRQIRDIERDTMRGEEPYEFLGDVRWSLSKVSCEALRYFAGHVETLASRRHWSTLGILTLELIERSESVTGEKDDEGYKGKSEAFLEFSRLVFEMFLSARIETDGHVINRWDDVLNLNQRPRKMSVTWDLDDSYLNLDKVLIRENQRILNEVREGKGENWSPRMRLLIRFLREEQGLGKETKLL